MPPPAPPPQTTTPEPRTPPAGLVVWGVVGLLAFAGLLLRVLASAGDLWLDELWTFGPEVAGKVRNPLEIVTRIHHENNHYLNTLVAWILGPDRPPLLYRLPSALAGGASVVFAARIGLRRSLPAGLFAAALIGGSYLLVHYGSEARGYSLAVCAALASWDQRDRLREQPGLARATTVAFAECLGLLAQPVFVCYLAAAGLIALGDSLPRAPDDRRRGLWQVAATIPGTVVFLGLYLIDLRLAFNPGGPVIPLGEVIEQTLSLVVGGPYEGPPLLWGGVCGGVLLAGAWWSLWKVERQWCVLTLLAGVLLPAVVVLIEARYELYPRYFLTGAALGQVTLALALARGWERPGVSRWIAALLFWGLVAGQARHVQRLLTWGRGDPVAFARLLRLKADGGPVDYAADHEFRIRTYVERGIAGLSTPLVTRLVADREARKQPPEWLIVHDFRVAPPFPAELRRGATVYQLEGTLPYAGLSGWGTALYRRGSR